MSGLELGQPAFRAGVQPSAPPDVVSSRSVSVQIVGFEVVVFRCVAIFHWEGSTAGYARCLGMQHFKSALELQPADARSRCAILCHRRYKRHKIVTKMESVHEYSRNAAVLLGAASWGQHHQNSTFRPPLFVAQSFVCLGS